LTEITPDAADEEWLAVIAEELCGRRLAAGFWKPEGMRHLAGRRALLAATLLGMAGLDDRCRKWLLSPEACAISVASRVSTVARILAFRRHDMTVHALGDSLIKMGAESGRRAVRWSVAAATARYFDNWRKVIGTPDPKYERDWPFHLAYMECLVRSQRWDELDTYVRPFVDEIAAMPLNLISRRLALALAYASCYQEHDRIIELMYEDREMHASRVVILAEALFRRRGFQQTLNVLDEYARDIQTPTLRSKASCLRLKAQANLDGNPISCRSQIEGLILDDPANEWLYERFLDISPPRSLNRIRVITSAIFPASASVITWARLLKAWRKSAPQSKDGDGW
jgi:hypothetical protein